MSHDIFKIIVAKDFTDSPGGRVPIEGPHSGEEFRDNILIPALHKHSGIIFIDLDNTDGFGSSFLEEAFGGLIRKGFKADEVLARLKFKSEDDDSLIDELIGYIHDANNRLK